MADIPVSKLAAMLKPYILDLIGAATGGVESFAPSPHDLSSSHHSGSILDAQAPQFLKTDGSRQLLGNLGVATGITVDGVDISVLKGDFDTHLSGADPHSQYVRKANADTISAVHTFNPASAGAPFALGANGQGQTVTGLKADQLNKSISAGTGLTGGGALTADRSLAIDLTASLTWTGNHVFQGSLTTRHILPELADAYDLGSSDKLWRRIYASEFDTFVLKANAISVVGGRMMVSKGEGTLAAAVTAAATTVDFGTAMSVNDIVLFRTLGKVEYMKIVSLSSGTTYNVTRNLDGSGANDWADGSVWVNLGYNGTGRIEFDAESTPRISIKRQGTTYNTLMATMGEPVRIGDLNGWDSVGTERYGIGLGDFAGGNYLRYEPSGGFVLKGGAGGVTIDGTGIQLGSSSGSLGNTTSIRFGSSLIAGAYLFSAGDYATTGFEMKGTLGTSSAYFRQIPRTWNYHDEWVLNSGTENTGRPGALSVGGYGDSYGSNRSYVNLAADDINISAHHNPSTGAPSIVMDDATAFPPTPSSGQSRINVRNGSPYIKRSSGAIHPLVQAEAVLREIPWFFMWGPGRRLPGGNPRILDLHGSGIDLLLNAVGNELYAVNLGTYHPVSCVTFNGSSSYIHYASCMDLVATTNHILAGGWFYFDSVGRNHGIMQLGHTTQMFDMWVDSANYVQFRTFHGSTGYTSARSGMTTGWHFVCGYSKWYSTANYAERIFVDGTWYNYSGSTPTEGLRTPSGSFIIGRAYNDSLYLQGRMWRGFYGYASGTGYASVEEYYALTKNYFQ